MAMKKKAALPSTLDQKQMKKLDWLELEQVSIWAKWQLINKKKETQERLDQMRKAMEKQFSIYQSEIDAIDDLKY